MLLPLAGFLLASCVTPAVTSDINDNAVKVVAGPFTKPEALQAEAARSCGIYNKTPIPISLQCLDEYCLRKVHLFACKSQATASSS
jgi:hypothetical protein